MFGGDTEGSRVLALDSVSLSIPAGQFVAVVGPSGCGKTTILNMLAGLLRPTVGTVLRHGKPVNGPSKDIGYMLARSALAPWRTARRNVELGLELARGAPQGAFGTGAAAVGAGQPRRSSPTSTRRSCPRACASGRRSPARSPSTPTCG